MAQNITITIDTPVLLGNQHFHVRYKLHQSLTWLDLGLKDNNPFTIPNLVDGDYDLWVNLVMADGTECEERIYYFPVISPSCNCFTSATGVVQEIRSQQFQINITITGMPAVQPKCGWKVNYQNSTTLFSTTYQTLPTNLIIPVPVNDFYLVDIIANCCDSEQTCATLDLSKAPITSCIGAIFGPDDRQMQIGQDQNGFFLTLIVTNQSTPPTSQFTVNYYQLNVKTPTPQQPFVGTPDSGTQVVNPTPYLNMQEVKFYINPNPNVTTFPFDYVVVVIDVCGNKIQL